MPDYSNIKLDSNLLQKAAEELERGGLVAFPTETVYGLGADASNVQAIIDLYALKGRPADHPSIVHLAEIDDIYKWAAEVPEGALKLAKRFWPGPMTLILPKKPEVSCRVTGGQESVGLRIPAHPMTRELIKIFGRGIVGPSANKFGHISPTSAEHVKNEFGSDLKYILDGGPCTVGVESTIIDFSKGRPVILRPGMLTEDLISSCLGEEVRFGTGSKAPGTLKKHYAPNILTNIITAEQLSCCAQKKASAFITYSQTEETLEGADVKVIAMPKNAEEYARSLYAALRYADSMEISQILIEKVPEDPQWAAVHDRIQRASAK